MNRLVRMRLVGLLTGESMRLRRAIPGDLGSIPNELAAFLLSLVGAGFMGELLVTSKGPEPERLCRG